MDLNYTPEDVAFRKQVRAWLEQNLPRGRSATSTSAGPGIASSTRRATSAWAGRRSTAARTRGRWSRPSWPTRWRAPTRRRPSTASGSASSARRSSCTAPTRRSGATSGRSSPPRRSGASSTPSRTRAPTWPRCKTSADGPGDHFVVNGQKIWTSGGAIADWGLLLARTDPKVPKHKGISCFLMDMRQPGVDVRPLKQITGSSEFCEVFMTNARVEKERPDRQARRGLGASPRPPSATSAAAARWPASPPTPRSTTRLVEAARAPHAPRPAAHRRPGGAPEARARSGPSSRWSATARCASSPCSSAASIPARAAR